jgi:diacylglycerol kinase (ATP)
MSPTTSPFGPLAVLVDPRAGNGAVAREVGAVEHALEARGLEYRLHVGDSSEELGRLSAAALDEGYRFLAAVGDDATVQDVVNGMFREGRPIVDAPVLGVVAAGSGSDLPLSFGLPGDTERAVGHLAGADTYPFDLMKIAVTGPDGERRIRYAHNVAEIGFHAAATIASARGGPRFHNWKRFTAFWRAYTRTRVTPVAIGTDRRTIELDAWSVVIGNGQFTDGGIRLSPRSFPGDGVLEGLVFTGPKSNAYRLLPRIFRHGDHVPDPSITEVHAKLKIDVTVATRALPVVADGQPLGVTPVTFQVVPQQILLKV